jgi:hypothetical protein
MIIITYPRSGSHYLRALIVQKLDTRIDGSHLIDDADGFVFTIARNPKDTLQSFITMSSHYHQDIGIQAEIDKYTALYGLLYTRANAVIDYDTLIKNPDAVIDSISYILNKPVIDHTYEDSMIDRPDEVYLVSSTTSELYGQNHLDGYDLSKAYEAYNLLLSRRLV